MPLVASVLLGLGVLVIGGCLDAGSALRAIRWDIYLLLGGLYSLSVALQQSGLAALVANRLLATIHTWPVYAALLAVYGLTLIATELLSNAAAVAPMLLITTVFAASQSFLSPIGYKANLMVFAPCRYRFLDILSYVYPLSLLYGVVVTALLFWLA
jgi:di/tricarboxylate transporter